MSNGRPVLEENAPDIHPGFEFSEGNRDFQKMFIFKGLIEKNGDVATPWFSVCNVLRQKFDGAIGTMNLNHPHFIAHHLINK